MGVPGKVPGLSPTVEQLDEVPLTVVGAGHVGYRYYDDETLVVTRGGQHPAHVHTPGGGKKKGWGGSYTRDLILGRRCTQH